MGPPGPRSLTLDAGALIAFDRGSPRLRALIRAATAVGADIHVPAGVLAQVWRDGRIQARLATLLKDEHVRVAVLDEPAARAVGVLLGRRGSADVVDASVVVCARVHGTVIVTSDPGDLLRLDPQAILQVV